MTRLTQSDFSSIAGGGPLRPGVPVAGEMASGSSSSSSSSNNNKALLPSPGTSCPKGPDCAGPLLSPTGPAPDRIDPLPPTTISYTPAFVNVGAQHSDYSHHHHYSSAITLSSSLDSSISNISYNNFGDGMLLLLSNTTTAGGQVQPAAAGAELEVSEYPPIKQPPYMILVLSLAYLLIFLCALVGNTMVVVVVVRNPRMRNVTNYLIANLAVADILVAVFCIPLTLLNNIYSGDLNCTIMLETYLFAQGAKSLRLTDVTVHLTKSVRTPQGRFAGNLDDG